MTKRVSFLKFYREFPNRGMQAKVVFSRELAICAEDIWQRAGKCMISGSAERDEWRRAEYGF